MILNCASKILDLSTPVTMAILNLTPDSFYDGGRFIEKDWQKKVIALLEQGPEIVDIGGMSSRPGATIIHPQDEWGRVQKALQFIKKEFPSVLISIDTIHSTTAFKALNEGAHIINDISGGIFDPKMMETIAPFNPAYVIMHMEGTPETMTKLTHYNNLVLDIFTFFKKQLNIAKSHGLMDVVIDPGFGFSKSLDQNYKLLNNMSTFRILTDNILVGISRKSMIYKVLGSSPKESLNGTSILHLKALENGAKILRVHDVKEAKEAIRLFLKLSVNK